MHRGLQGGHVFRFDTHPGAVTVGEGVQMAFDYLQTTWRKWLPVVVVVAAFTFVAYALVGPVDFGSSLTSQTTTNRNVTTTYVGLFVSFPMIVVSWVFTAA